MNHHISTNTITANCIWGVILGVFASFIIQAAYWAVEDPVPYKDVIIQEVSESEKGYLIEAHFTKVECTFKRLEVFGDNTGRLTLLNWFPRDGQTSSEYDRSEGEQHLIIEVETKIGEYDNFEIRTRHDCDGEKVDKVFAKVPLRKEDKTDK